MLNKKSTGFRFVVNMQSVHISMLTTGILITKRDRATIKYETLNF